MAGPRTLELRGHAPFWNTRALSAIPMMSPQLMEENETCGCGCGFSLSKKKGVGRGQLAPPYLLNPVRSQSMDVTFPPSQSASLLLPSREVNDASGESGPG